MENSMQKPDDTPKAEPQKSLRTAEPHKGLEYAKLTTQIEPRKSYPPNPCAPYATLRNVEYGEHAMLSTDTPQTRK